MTIFLAPLGGSHVSVFALGLALATPAVAAAETAPEPNDEIVVTGYATSLQKATELKRDAPYSLDAVNAEDIGKFPSRNAAEALQLIPGVALVRQRGEGLLISVRGLGPQFQLVTLNGSSIAVNDLIENGGVSGRSFRYEVLPTVSIQQITVAKTPMADMEEGALGGNIDVKTFKPFDIGTTATFNGRLAYNDLRKRADPSISGVVSWVNTDKTFGVLASALYDKRSVRNDRFFNFGWNLNQFTTAARGGLATGLYTPTRTRPTIELEDRTRWSGSVSLQWSPTPELETTIDGLATRLDVDFDEFGLDIYPDTTVAYPNFAAEAAIYPSLAALYSQATAARVAAGNPATYASPIFVAGTARVVGDTVVAGTINNVRWMSSRETSLNRHDLYAIKLHQKWTPGQWDIQGDVAHSYARSYHPTGLATTRSRMSFVAPLTFDFSGGIRTIPTIATTANFNDPAIYVGQAFDYTSKDSRDSDTSVRLDIGRKFDGALSRIRFGAGYHKRHRNYIRRDWSVNPVFGLPVNAAPLGSSFYGSVPYTNFLSAFPGNSPRTWVAPSRTAFYNLIFTDAVAARTPDAASLRSSFEVDEQIYSGYALAEFGFDIGSIALTGNAGVRYAKTKQVASGTADTAGVLAAVSFPKTYDDWLPSLNLRAQLTRTLVARLAASRTVNRPNLVDVAPRLTISRDANSASGGNPNLNPYRATQLDFSLEWYFAQQGALTGAIFYKKLDSYITASNVILQNVPGKVGDVILSTQANGGTASLKGVEFSYNQVFNFLPQPFDGLGAQASLTLIEVTSSYAAGNRTLTDRLVGLSKLSYNVVGFYEKGPVSARLGYFWRDRYLDGNGSSVSAESYVAPFGSLDGSIAYSFGDNFTLSLDVINLTRARKYVYGASELQPREINDYGRTFTLSARAKF
jgi:iron complex outermembrane recepter protein